MTSEFAASQDSQAWEHASSGASVQADSLPRFRRTRSGHLPARALPKKRCDADNLRFDFALRKQVNTRTNDHDEIDASGEKTQVMAK